ncbi:hypothetical protein SAMN05216593_1233 [Pseudomonas asturiensis]|uniref:mRNA interferase RelE/StbE n=1 Tax=Pseudomonas asturiensis TaxID=1190415 RepID=A0A1M7QCX3_9PSED|nr:hypothetical protein SAMN05216593_1233 [Pseudomonas asturiensis]
MTYDLEFDVRALKGWHKLGREKTWRRVRDQCKRSINPTVLNMGGALS